MKKYAAFLRGINVGNIRIKMPDLTRAFEQMGCRSVKTFLQTGNVVFESAESIDALKLTLEKGLTETFNYEAYVLLVEHTDLNNMIKSYPFSRDEQHHAYALLVQDIKVIEELLTLAQSLETQEEVAGGQGVLYWKCAVGETLGTPFSKILSKAKYKSTTTMRNLNTLEKMVDA